MFAANYIIDAVQTAKLDLFRKIVSDPQLQKLAEDYIKAQSNFAKAAVTTTFDLAQYSFEKMSKPYFPENPGATAPKK